MSQTAGPPPTDGDGAHPPATGEASQPPATGEASQPPAAYDRSKLVVLAPGPGTAPAAGRRPDWLVGQLPVGMLDDNFFYRFVSIFQEQAGTYLDGIDNLPNILDPAVAPPPMVRFLAGWLALPPVNPALDEVYQRHLVLQASRLQWWRGTKRGLSGLLELFTGGPVDVTDTGGVFRQSEGARRPAQVSVRVNSVGWLSEQDLVELVRDEVPANVDLEVYVGDRRIFPVTQVPPPAPPPDRDPTRNGHDGIRATEDEMKPAF
jgi:phage tail-like protein